MVGPLSFLISSVFGIYLYIWILSEIYLNGHIPHLGKFISIAAVYEIFNILGNWFFISQYLRTSKILPIQFTEARLEWVLKDNE